MVKIDFVNAQEPAINDTNLNQMQLNIENAINAQVSGDTLPVGCIVPFTSDTVPENWLLCDGSAVSRTDYALLFSIIGITYGVGDGSTTFNLPDLRTRVPLGKGTATGEGGESYNFQLGDKGGEYSHILTINEMPSHNHTLNTSAETGTHDNGYIHNGSYTLSSQSATTENAGGGQAHNILQPFTVTNFIIKARQSSGLVATVVDGLNSTSTTDALSANQGRLLGEYSINNEIVVGHWTDNKPIYRKVVSGQVSTANTWTTIATISDINTLIDVKGTVGGYLPVPVYISSSYNVAVQKYNNEIQVRTNGYTNSDVILAIEYTKTND